MLGAPSPVAVVPRFCVQPLQLLHFRSLYAALRLPLRTTSKTQKFETVVAHLHIEIHRELATTYDSSYRSSYGPLSSLCIGILCSNNTHLCNHCIYSLPHFRSLPLNTERISHETFFGVSCFVVSSCSPFVNALGSFLFRISNILLSLLG